MQSVKLLDCTLRDGGFLNDWNFGYSSIQSIFSRLVKSDIDIIEIGFIDDRRKFDINRTINPNTESFDKIFNGQKKRNSLIVGMIDYGTCSLENISLSKNSFIDGIRVIFKKKDVKNAIDFCKKIKEKGYKVFVNPVSITTYSDREMLDLIDMVNELNPVAMSLVDTYGLLHKDRLFKYFYLLDNNLNKNIGIGYHSHNNFQLAYSNAIELLNLKTNRTIILDSSLYGMGKSAGNCNTELLAMYLNTNINKKYDMPEILNAIDLEILKYLKQFEWGYQITYYLSALNDCHPNYVKYLEKKNMLPIKDINNILNLIPNNKKLTFDENCIEKLYQKYLQRNLDDKKDYKQLRQELENTEVLLLGPGSSVKIQKNKIQKYIENNKLKIFSVNHVNRLFDTDYIFISNPKRYDQFINGDIRNKISRIIITSNIEDAENNADYILNWNNIKSSSTIIGESSLYLLIKILIKLNVKNVILAGFDGFKKYAENYYDDSFRFYREQESIKETTNAIIQQIAEFKKQIKIEFLTDSEYSKDYADV